MTMNIINQTLFASDGKKLKEISCPRRVESSQLPRSHDGNYACNYCDRTVINTDLLSEFELVEAIQEDPTVCLYINLVNPLFKRITDA